MKFDLAMRTAGSTFLGSLFGKPNTTIRKNFDGRIEGYIMVKLKHNKIDRKIIQVPELVKSSELFGEDDRFLLTDKVLLKIIQDPQRQHDVLQRILDVLVIHECTVEHLELFSVDSRVADIVTGYLTIGDEGAKRSWTKMTDEEKRGVLEFMHELKEKEGNLNTLELSFLYDLQSVLFA